MSVSVPTSSPRSNMAIIVFDSNLCQESPSSDEGIWNFHCPTLSVLDVHYSGGHIVSLKYRIQNFFHMLLMTALEIDFFCTFHKYLLAPLP